MAAGAAFPDLIGLHAVLAAPDVSRRRILEISRDPSFLRGSGMDLGGALPPREPPHRHDLGRRHSADGGDLAEYHALGRTVHDLSFSLRSRQPQLDAGSVEICAGDAGF